VPERRHGAALVRGLRALHGVLHGRHQHRRDRQSAGPGRRARGTGHGLARDGLPNGRDGVELQTLKPGLETRELYLPEMAEITAVRRLTALETLYTVKLPGGRDLGHRPGQFVEVSLFGVGEA